MPSFGIPGVRHGLSLVLTAGGGVLAALAVRRWQRVQGALIARVLGSAVSHPSLMATYREHYILPRRRVAALLLERAQQAGTVADDADFDVAIDMMVGAITYRVLQPNPPDLDEARRNLRAVHRQGAVIHPAQCKALATIS